MFGGKHFFTPYSRKEYDIPGALWYTYKYIYKYICTCPGEGIYISERRCSEYANPVSDTIIFFCADVFAQKPARIICLSRSENGKLRTVARGALVRRSLFGREYFFIFYVYAQGLANGRVGW